VRVAFGTTVLLRRSLAGFSTTGGGAGAATGCSFAAFFLKKLRNGIVIA
jgi:hypothetical protein